MLCRFNSSELLMRNRGRDAGSLSGGTKRDAPMVGGARSLANESGSSVGSRHSSKAARLAVESRSAGVASRDSDIYDTGFQPSVQP